jgi:large subunit ribosomal protein L4
MKVKLRDNNKAVEFADSMLGAEFNEPLVHQVVNAYLAGRRSGTKAQKTRAEVRGGGRKPWRQKGTGQARAGTSRSPIWVGGGRTFAAKPRGFDQKVNRKMYRAAMRSVLSELFRQERLVMTTELAVGAPKTKELKVKLADVVGTASGRDLGRVLIVVEAFNGNLWLAARNLPNVWVLDAVSVDPVSLVGADKVIMTAAAAKIIEERVQ